MNNSKGFSMFQIVVFIVCAVGVAFALLIFSGKIPVGQSAADTTLQGTLVVWGTLPGDLVGGMDDELHQANKEVTINYVQKDPATFESDLVNALASGDGPDMVYITPADVIPNKDRLLEIPYTSFPQALFQQTFIDQGDQFLTSTGVLAFPFIVDPLVMYYNKDLLTSSYTVNPPKTWDDLVALNQKITAKDDAGKLSTETVALGTFDNVTHAKDIIEAMIFQTGNKIVAFDPDTQKYMSQFQLTDSSGNSGVANALSFYTAFANVNDAAHYSWNGSLPNDRDQFVAGKLATYFGYASELESIRQENPNLNFDVSVFPQRVNGTIKATYGQMTGLAIIKVSKNIPLAIAMAQQIVSKANLTNYTLSDPTAMPARRDMLTLGSDADAHQTLFYDSTIISQSFLDPDPVQTSALFKQFVNQIDAGLVQPAAILSPGESLLSGILAKVQKDTSGQ